MIKNGQDSDLYHGFTKVHHVEPQSNWLPKECWKNLTVLRYQKEMTEKLEAFLGVPLKKPLTRRNVSHGDPVTLDPEDLEWLRDQYREDFELWDAVNSQPELFKKVI